MFPADDVPSPQSTEAVKSDKGSRLVKRSSKVATWPLNAMVATAEIASAITTGGGGFTLNELPGTVSVVSGAVAGFSARVAVSTSPVPGVLMLSAE